MVPKVFPYTDSGPAGGHPMDHMISSDAQGVQSVLYSSPIDADHLRNNIASPMYGMQSVKMQHHFPAFSSNILPVNTSRNRAHGPSVRPCAGFVNVEQISISSHQSFVTGVQSDQQQRYRPLYFQQLVNFVVIFLPPIRVLHSLSHQGHLG